MRVRTRRFEKLRSCESRDSKFVEVFHREDTVQSSFAMPPPVPRAPCNEDGQLMGCTKVSEPTVDSRSRAPVLELKGPQPVAYP